MESMGGGCSDMCWMYMYLYIHMLVKKKDGLDYILKPGSYGFKELSPYFLEHNAKVSLPLLKHICLEVFGLLGFPALHIFTYFLSFNGRI